VGLSYLPYVSAGWHLFKGLSDYTAGWESNDSLFRLIRLVGNSKSQAELVAGALVLILVIYTLRRRLEPLAASLLLISGMLFLSPDAFPWYFTWIVPFLCFYPRAPLLLLTITSVLGYAPVVAYAAGQPYRDSPFILLLEYAPVLVWVLYESCRSTDGLALPPSGTDSPLPRGARLLSMTANSRAGPNATAPRNFT
jgi:hypothetical protein